MCLVWSRSEEEGSVLRANSNSIEPIDLKLVVCIGLKILQGDEGVLCVRSLKGKDVFLLKIVKDFEGDSVAVYCYGRRFPLESRRTGLEVGEFQVQDLVWVL